MDHKEKIIAEIENKENENSVMRSMLITVKDNLKVSEKLMLDKDKEIRNEKELLDKMKLDAQEWQIKIDNQKHENIQNERSILDHQKEL
jgi:hypothetical protein